MRTHDALVAPQCGVQPYIEIPITTLVHFVFWLKLCVNPVKYAALSASGLSPRGAYSFMGNGGPDRVFTHSSTHLPLTCL
eukprot:7535750-Alexandrium_andersonii.AAC.1